MPRSAVLALLAADRRCAAAESLAEILDEGADWQVAVDGLGFADGLSFDAAGNVFFADLRAKRRRLQAVPPTARRPSSPPAAAAVTRLGPDGRLYACGGKTLVGDRPGWWEGTPVAGDLGTNDLAVSPAPYITDTGKKQVTVVDPKTGQARAADTGIAAQRHRPQPRRRHALRLRLQRRPERVVVQGPARRLAGRQEGADDDEGPENGRDGRQRGRLTVDSAAASTTALGPKFDPAGKLLGVLPKPGNGPLVRRRLRRQDLDQLYTPAATSCTADPRR